VPDYSFDLPYRIGEVYLYRAELDKALQYFDIYRKRLLSKPGYNGRDRIELSEVDNRIQNCINAREYAGRRVKCRVISVGRSINSEFHDYAPVLNFREDKMYFTSRRILQNSSDQLFADNHPFEEIFVSQKDGGSWTKALSAGAQLNSQANESALYLDDATNQLYLYVGNGDIYYSTYEDGGFSKPLSVKGEINGSKSFENSLCLSPDHKTAIFTSDRAGGLGGMDLYVTRLEAGK
jgi:hypothetical protein